jgi:hypothetical protein
MEIPNLYYPIVLIWPKRTARFFIKFKPSCQNDVEIARMDLISRIAKKCRLLVISRSTAILIHYCARAWVYLCSAVKKIGVFWKDTEYYMPMQVARTIAENKH